MWIADVGQDAWEEINFQAAPSTGGENYGWRCYEADAPFNTENCGSISTFTSPVHAYPHILFPCGGSITGGFVYRGTVFPNLRGHYIYADYCTGLISSLTPDDNGGWINQILLNWNNFEISSFGQDQDGEVYMLAVGQGHIYQLTSPSN